VHSTRELPAGRRFSHVAFELELPGPVQGDNDQPQPSWLSTFTEKYKWQAWTERKGMTREAARARYISEMEQRQPDWRAYTPLARQSTPAAAPDKDDASVPAVAEEPIAPSHEPAGHEGVELSTDSRARSSSPEADLAGTKPSKKSSSHKWTKRQHILGPFPATRRGTPVDSPLARGLRAAMERKAEQGASSDDSSSESHARYRRTRVTELQSTVGELAAKLDAEMTRVQALEQAMWQSQQRGGSLSALFSLLPFASAAPEPCDAARSPADAKTPARAAGGDSPLTEADAEGLASLCLRLEGAVVDQQEWLGDRLGRVSERLREVEERLGVERTDTDEDDAADGHRSDSEDEDVARAEMGDSGPGAYRLGMSWAARSGLGSPGLRRRGRAMLESGAGLPDGGEDADGTLTVSHLQSARGRTPHGRLRQQASAASGAAGAGGLGAGRAEEQAAAAAAAAAGIASPTATTGRRVAVGSRRGLGLLLRAIPASLRPTVVWVWEVLAWLGSSWSRLALTVLVLWAVWSWLQQRAKAAVAAGMQFRARRSAPA
jgi:hypothetical protein